MNPGSLERDVDEKRWELRQRIREIREVSVEIKEDIEEDKYRTGNLTSGYGSTRQMLGKTMKSLETVLDNNETRLMLYIVGSVIIVFVVLWKLFK
jgi:hypothetical protein